MKFIKICVVFLSLLLFCSAAGGCYNYIDVDDQFVVTAVCVDQDQYSGEYIMLTEITKSAGGADPKMISEVGYTKSKSLFEAMRENIPQIGAKLYYGHITVFIIGENLASEGIADVLSIMERQSQIRSDMHVIISDDKSLYKILEFDDPIHEDISQHISGLLETCDDSGRFRRSPLYRVIQELASPEISLILPIITMTNIKDEIVDKEDQEDEEEKQEEEKQEEEKQEQTSEEKESSEEEAGKENTSQDEIPLVKGSAVFKKDKMVGTLDEYETRSALILKKELKNNYCISLKESETIPTCTIEVINSSINIEPVVLKDNKNLRFDIELELEGDLVELGGPIDYIADEAVGVLEIEFEKLIKNQLNEVIQIAQHKYCADIFGFAGITHIKQPKFWKEMSSVWDDVFKQIRYEITVTVDISSSALSMNPLKVGR